jgi:hypothetical protein
MVSTVVSATHVARSRLLLLQTRLGELRTTDEHPLAMENGQFRDAGECQPGERILALRNGRVRPVAVLDVKESESPVTVFQPAGRPSSHVHRQWLCGSQQRGRLFPRRNADSKPRAVLSPSNNWFRVTPC